MWRRFLELGAAAPTGTGDLLITNQLAEALFSEGRPRFLPQTSRPGNPSEPSFRRDRCSSLWHWFVACANALALTDGPRPLAHFTERSPCNWLPMPAPPSRPCP